MVRVPLGQALFSSNPNGPDPADVVDWYHRRLKDCDQAQRENGGLPRHEVWRAQYLQNPYLLLCSDEELRERWIDVFANTTILTEDGMIGMDPDEIKKPGSMTEAFTHMLEACNARGGAEGDFIAMGNAEIQKYFEHGEPPGVSMFKGMPMRLKNCIVKFSRREFLEPMLREGRVRLAPASYYARGGHLKSIRDLETQKTLRIPAINEALAGKTHINYQGANLPIEGGAITMPIVVPDYFLFSTCLNLDRRMPTDFEANAALIIRDAHSFSRQLKKAFKKEYGQSDVYCGPVTYFDPFRWRPNGKILPEMMKHFAFSYQKEYRIAARPIGNTFDAEPIFLQIGSMQDYAEIVPRL
ncbi:MULTISPECIES: hypothetical protein [unclassified Ruegeria]|uniref:hypothetical protein n=1 Tax=unclassified Ruegeria TaxID=2625375 RepID=UPI001488F17B|nr:MULTISPECIES: hypothetical protein [unclassified Ruegeria]NOD65694.1 hypothetical protein [Ruegeria sp. HKCCD6109]